MRQRGEDGLTKGDRTWSEEEERMASIEEKSVPRKVTARRSPEGSHSSCRIGPQRLGGGGVNFRSERETESIDHSHKLAPF